MVKVMAASASGVFMAFVWLDSWSSVKAVSASPAEFVWLACVFSPQKPIARVPKIASADISATMTMIVIAFCAPDAAGAAEAGE